MYILEIITGPIILFLGGEILIKGSVSLAKHLSISQVLVSAVIIGFGTSMPEMVVSVDAMIKNSPEIAIGNIVGSNIANVLLIIGLSAVIFPISLKNIFINRDAVVMLVATILFVFFSAFNGEINFFEGVLMLAILAVYIVYSYSQSSSNASDKEFKNIESGLWFFSELSLIFSVVFCVIGFAFLIAGSSLFLNGAIALSNKLNISKEIVGIGIVAFGSCLPELATSIVASYRKNGNIVIGSVVGSNIFNLLSIAGIIALIEDVLIPARVLQFDIWVFLLVMILFFVMIINKITFKRSYGFIFILSYSTYLGALFGCF